MANEKKLTQSPMLNKLDYIIQVTPRKVLLEK